MSLGPYQGQFLVPGMGSESYSAEHDLMGMIYGSPHLCLFATHAVVGGDARDTGNTGNTTTLRPGLIMAQNSTSKKWYPFNNSAADGTEIPLGILTFLGLNTQQGGSDADRFLATIMVKGNVNPDALVLAANTAYGIDKVTAADIVVRKAFKYNFMFSDDFQNFTAEALGSR